MVIAYGNTVAERATGRKYIDWPAQPETGIPRMSNEQQKWLIALVASLDDRASEVHVISALALLSDYVRSHCDDDDLGVDNEVDHPRGKTHRRLYREFQNMLSDLRGRAHMMSLDEIARELRYLINGWLCSHMIVADF